MTDAPRTRLPWWVRAADMATLVLALLACIVFVTGGFRRVIAGVTIQLMRSSRVFALAFLVGLVRHVAFRRPNLWQRAVDFARRATHDVPLSDDDLQAAVAPAWRVSLAELAVVTAGMIALTLFMTYPQIDRLDSVSDLGDPVFSTWRLAWIAHQLPRDPLHLFDANIFAPHANALAYSDPLLLPGFVAAPVIWLGVRPIVIHSLLLLASFVLAGVAMYLFVRALTRQRHAAIVAAIAFAFHPYRFDHYAHFEQQFSFWMPLALWGLHRTLARGRVRDGLLTGAAVAAQFLSGEYMGAFFVAYFVPVAVVLALGWNRVRTAVKPLLAGAALSVVLVAPVVPAHFAVKQVTGDRPPSEVEFYSARPYHYLMPHGQRVIYREGLIDAPHEGEKDLFPGIAMVGLALFALWPPLSAARIAYLAGLVFAFEASLGLHGYTFSFLYDAFVPFRAFRVPARFAMLVGLSLCILTGYGVARLTGRLKRPWVRHAVTAALSIVLLVEVWSPRPLTRVWPLVHPVYRWFEGRPTAVVADLPAGEGNLIWKRECRYMYASTFHWQRLLNGYSGAFPASYDVFKIATMRFPDDGSIGVLRGQGAEYAVVHEEYYGRDRYRAVVEAIESRRDLQMVTSAVSDGWEARIYRLVK